MAKNIQLSCLPGDFPAFPGRSDLDIYAIMQPAKDVGGDFYDFYFSAPSILNFLIADVSGKGIPAAMFMMRAKAQLKSLVERDVNLADALSQSNDALCEGNDAGMFITAWAGQVDMETGVVTYANAGHNPPLLRHADGRFEYQRRRTGLVFAVMDGLLYKTATLQMEPGDVLFLYTDGVTEATRNTNELYGEDRLLETVNSVSYTTMEDLCKAVKADVDAFVGTDPQFDDITMLAFRYNGPACKDTKDITE